MQKAKDQTKRKKWVVATAIIATIVLVLPFILYDFYVNGSEYRKMVKQCGTKELVIGEVFPKDPQPKYTRPADPNYSVPWPNAEYFCTEQDAIDAGYIPLYDEDGMYNQD